jgi:Oxidoreductase family, NAD-binding Rossmann fold
MASGPAYAIAGKGRWGQRMYALLDGEDRQVDFLLEVRQKDDEPDGAYVSRMAEQFRKSAAQVAWLCVPPGAHVPLLMRATLDAGLHVIVEKPWVYSAEETAALQQLAEQKARNIGVHFEYCFLSKVESWQQRYGSEADLQFGGSFTVTASDRTGTPAIQNLGSHLLAMHTFAVPQSGIGEIRCAYETQDQRLIWLDSRERRIEVIDFFNSKEPIIQRFLVQFESGMDGTPFRLDLNFALRVKEELEGLKNNAASKVAPERENS